MYVQREKPKENKSKAIANSVAQKESNVKQGFGFVDNRPEAEGQRALQRMMNYGQTKASQMMGMQAKLPVITKETEEREGGEPIQKFSSHPKSNKPPEVSLSTEEAEGGHTIERHLITREKAMTRVVNEGQVPSSIWLSESKANEATNRIISKNWFAIKKWANTQGNGQYPNDLIEDNTKGKVFWEDLGDRDSERARLYLYRAKAAPGDAEVEVRVVTCYPEHAAKPADVGPAKKGNIKRTDKW